MGGGWKGGSRDEDDGDDGTPWNGERRFTNGAERETRPR